MEWRRHFCRIGWHRWVERAEGRRRCVRCRREEVFVADSYGGWDQGIWSRCDRAAAQVERGTVIVMDRPILCLDFDGVIHKYNSGWQGALVIADDVTDGFFEWLDEAAQHFKIVVYSSRSKEPGACVAMALWMAEQRRKWRERGGKSSVADGTEVQIEFASTKPAAFLQIDDRVIQFDGDWSSFDPAELAKFKPWNKR